MYTSSRRHTRTRQRTSRRCAILQALEETRRHHTLAAKKLGMSFRSLRYRLKKMGLDQDDGDDAGSGQA